MKTSAIKHSIASFLLILFLSLKLVGLHALSHVDNQDHDTPCEICDYALINNIIPALTPEPLAFIPNNTEVVFNQLNITTYYFKTSSTIASNQLFSRPPPYFI